MQIKSPTVNNLPESTHEKDMPCSLFLNACKPIYIYLKMKIKREQGICDMKYEIPQKTYRGQLKYFLCKYEKD